ncbi:zinc finger protein 410 [Elysia marginata]|uniref:Zinc finger protein 410 n=1 Tax=Elysia marginata TaxID=1093978 RepID=A0AAV4I6P5_9GAST|nr:zinc finger protein 410 [Elysia marginata]
MASSLFSDNHHVMIDAVASLLTKQHELNKTSGAASLSSPLLVLRNMPGKDSLLADVIMGSSEKTESTLSNQSQGMVPNFEQVHALATASLLASTQRNIAKQLEEEEEANANVERARKKNKCVVKCGEYEKTKSLHIKKERKATAGAEQKQRKAKPVPSLCVRVEESKSYSEQSKPRESKTFVCSFEGCARKFAWLNHLKYHELTHTNNRQFKCPDELCGKTFFTAQRLNVHLRTHTGERPFKCGHEDCGKTFSTAGNLKNHQRIHTGEQPYVCDIDGCNRRFTERSSLTKHKLTHSGDKPFECKLCGKRFTQSGSRSQHLIRHHLDDEIRNSIKQKLLNSGARDAELQNKSDSACGNVDSGENDNSGNKVVKLNGVEGNSEANGSQSEMAAVSCSPHVLVLSNSYPGLPTSEPVVFPHRLSDHIVTVTTQPDPCSVCRRQVTAGFTATRCSICNLWVHRRCSQLTKSEICRLPKQHSWICPTHQLAQRDSRPTSPHSSSTQPSAPNIPATPQPTANGPPPWATFAPRPQLPVIVPTPSTSPNPPSQTPASSQTVRPPSNEKELLILQWNCRGFASIKGRTRYICG